MTNAKDIRDQIRTATLGAKTKAEAKIVTFNSVDIEVRTPNLAGRNACLKKSMTGEDQTVDVLKWQVWSIIDNSYVPGTDERVFDDTDFDVISESATGGFADKIWEVVQELNNMSVDDAKKN